MENFTWFLVELVTEEKVEHKMMVARTGEDMVDRLLKDLSYARETRYETLVAIHQFNNEDKVLTKVWPKA
jgi:hypothetical protein